jgi:hypothetical protein
VEGLPLDVEYVAVAEAGGFGRSEEATGLLVHRQRREARADLAVRAPAVVVVRVVDLHRAPVTEPAQVMLGGPLDGHRKTAPDEANLYRFEGVSAGVWQVSVESPSYRAGRGRVEAVPGTTAEAIVHLDPGAIVEGVVVDEAGKPVPRATVDVGPLSANPEPWKFDFLMDSRSATTSETGAFAVRGLPPGDAFVQARRFADPTTPTLETPERLRLSPPASGLRLVVRRLGRVVLRLVTPDGVPYVGPIYAWTGRTAPRQEGSGGRTEDGVVRFDGLGDGDHHLDVDADGFATLRRTVTVATRAVVDLGDVRLDPGVPIAGRVVDPEDHPVAGARVEAGGRDQVAADANGAFVLDHVTPGPIEVEASADGFLGARQDVDARAGTGPLVLRLARGALVRALVRASDRKPADDARLVAILLDARGQPVADGPREWDAADAEGRATWRLPPGRWRLAWGVKTGETYEEVPLGEWTFAEGDEKDLDLTLPAR